MERPKRSRALVVSVTGHRNLGRTSRRVARVLLPSAFGCARNIPRANSSSYRRWRRARIGSWRALPSICWTHGWSCQFRCRSTTPKVISRISQRASKNSNACSERPTRSSSRLCDLAVPDGAPTKRHAKSNMRGSELMSRNTPTYCLRFGIGKPARGLGGTAQVVKWFLANHVPRAHSTLVSSQRAGPLAEELRRFLSTSSPKTGQIERLASGTVPSHSRSSAG